MAVASGAAATETGIRLHWRKINEQILLLGSRNVSCAEAQYEGGSTAATAAEPPKPAYLEVLFGWRAWPPLENVPSKNGKSTEVAYIRTMGNSSKRSDLCHAAKLMR